jgi:hypothetical protein
MADGANGARTPLDDFTLDQLKGRFRKATDLHSRMKCQSSETCSAYQSHVIPDVLRYLDLTAQEAKLEFLLRNRDNEMMWQRNRLLAIEPSTSTGLDLRSYFDEFESTRADVEHVRSFLFQIPKSLEKIRIELAAISAQEINSHMDALGVSEGDPLRPPLRSQSPTRAELTDSKRLSPKVQEFRELVAREWKKRRKGLGGKRTPVPAIRAIARECDENKFKPVPPFIEPTLERQIHKWNTAFPKRKIVTFEDMVERSIEPQPRFKLGVFRKFLGNTASSFTQKQD